MSTARNVFQFDNQKDYTGTTTTTNAWYPDSTTGYQTYWYPSYVYKTDEVAELKAWLDGFMTGRKMTERNLKKIQEKLEDFIS